MDHYKELITKINKADIPDSYNPIVSMIGLDNFVKLCQYAMGDEIYFPTPESILRSTRNRMILQDYNGYNIKELSKKYNLTQAHIKNIVKGLNSK